MLRLFSSQALLATNDNWQDTDAAAILATNLQPSDPHESALIASLGPGGYTVIVSGAQNDQGVALVEVYDLESNSPTHLANISTRGVVEGGDNVLIGGVIIGGSDSGRFVARAIGPSLSTFVNDPLPNPVLELHDADGNTIAFNDDWRDDPQAADLEASHLAPTNDLEAAILRTLPPGSYTVIVRSISPSTTGVALVEIYSL